MLQVFRDRVILWKTRLGAGKMRLFIATEDLKQWNSLMASVTQPKKDIAALRSCENTEISSSTCVTLVDENKKRMLPGPLFKNKYVISNSHIFLFSESIPYRKATLTETRQLF